MGYLKRKSWLWERGLCGSYTPSHGSDNSPHMGVVTPHIMGVVNTHHHGSGNSPSSHQGSGTPRPSKQHGSQSDQKDKNTDLKAHQRGNKSTLNSSQSVHEHMQIKYNNLGSGLYNFAWTELVSPGRLARASGSRPGRILNPLCQLCLGFPSRWTGVTRVT